MTVRVEEDGTVAGGYAFVIFDRVLNGDSPRLSFRRIGIEPYHLGPEKKWQNEIHWHAPPVDSREGSSTALRIDPTIVDSIDEYTQIEIEVEGEACIETLCWPSLPPWPYPWPPNPPPPEPGQSRTTLIQASGRGLVAASSRFVELYDEITGLLNSRLGGDYAFLLSKPEVVLPATGTDPEIAWSVAGQHVAKPLSSLGAEETSRLCQRVYELYAGVSTLADELERHDPASRDMAQLLRLAVDTNNDAAQIWSVDDRPVLVGWGYRDETKPPPERKTTILTETGTRGLKSADPHIEEKYDEIAAVLSEKLGDDHAFLLAKPEAVVTGAETKIRWSVPGNHEARPASSLALAEQQRLQVRIAELREGISTLADRLEHEEPASVEIVHLLRHAIDAGNGAEQVWSVDGRPVLVRWGYRLSPWDPPPSPPPRPEPPPRGSLWMVLFVAVGIAAMILVPTLRTHEERLPQPQPQPQPQRPPPPALVPWRPGDQRPSFNCNRASTPAERLICADKDLAQADWEMSRSLKEKRDRLPRERKDQLDREQMEWIRRRDSECDIPTSGRDSVEGLAEKYKSCLESSTNERDIELIGE